MYCRSLLRSRHDATMVSRYWGAGLTNQSRSLQSQFPVLRPPRLSAIDRAARRACTKTHRNNLPHVAASLARSSPGPRVSIPDSALPNPRILEQPRTVAAVDLRWQRGGCLRHGPLRLPAPGSGLLVTVASPRSGAPGYSSETKCWSARVKMEAWWCLGAPLAPTRSPTGPSRRSHGPYQGYPPPGCGTRPLAQCTGRWRCSIRGYKVAGVFGKQDKRQVTGAAALTSKWARIVSITVSHRTSNRTISISTIRPQMQRAVRPSAELRCVQADNRLGSFHTPRYCLDLHQYQVYTAVTSKTIHLTTH